MASKRRFTDSAIEGSNPKHRTPGTDDVTTEQGNEIKTEENSEDVFCSHPGSYKSMIGTDTDIQVKDEPEEGEYGPTNKTDRNGPGWDIGDEKPVICELPVEMDEVDPLRPFDEVKDEPMDEDTVKTENDECFGENSSAAEEIRREARTDIAKPRSTAATHKSPLQEPTHFTEIKIKASERRTTSELRDFLSWVSQRSSTSGSPPTPSKPQESNPTPSKPLKKGPGATLGSTRRARHQEEGPALASEPNTDIPEHNTNIGRGPRQEEESVLAPSEPDSENNTNIGRDPRQEEDSVLASSEPDTEHDINVGMGPMQDEDSALASEPDNHQNTNLGTDNPTQDSENEDLTGSQSSEEAPKFDEEASQPSPKKPTLSDTPEDTVSSITVQLLVQSSFLITEKLTEEQNKIIGAGRPTPLLGIDGDSDQGFWVTEKEYLMIPWLTGLRRLQRYYCWPCLLFTKGRWTVLGGMDEKLFWAAIKHHSECSLHKAAYENLKLRESTLKDAEHEAPNPNDIVKANRALLELLIRILCTKKTKLHNTDPNFDGYEELMKVAIFHEPDLHQLFGKLPNEDGLVDFVSRHAPKLLSSIESKISASISEEISRSQYVSVIYEDTVSIVDRSSQVAVIIRLLTKSGDICERFVKLVKIRSSRNAYDILEIHLSVIEELGIKEKLVGFTFSGTVVATSSIEEFITIVSDQSPKAKFFHHPDHNLKELLLQSLSHVKECQRFLEVISQLVRFLTTNSGAIPTLVTFIKHNVKDCRHLEDARSFTTDIIFTIRVYYPLIIEFFSKVSEKFWNDEVAKQAPIFMQFLQEPSNRFLIAVIATILDTVDDLSKAMENYDSEGWMNQGHKVMVKLKELYEKGANHYVLLACKMNVSSNSSGISSEIRKDFVETFKKVLETALICVFHRANSGTFYLNSAYKKTSDILQSEENWNRYGLPFESSTDFHEQMKYNNAINSTFNKKSIPEIAKAVANMQISNLTLEHLKSSKFLVWQDFIRFCAMTISPTKSTTTAPSTVLKLKYYLKDKQEPKATDVLMFLEKGILRSHLQNAEFIKELITQYARKYKQYNFLYNSPVAECKLEIDNCM